MSNSELHSYEIESSSFPNFDKAYLTSTAQDDCLTRPEPRAHYILDKGKPLLTSLEARNNNSCHLFDIGTYDDISNIYLERFRSEFPAYIAALCEHLEIRHSTVLHIHNPDGEWLKGIPIFAIKNDSISSLCQPIRDRKPKTVLIIDTNWFHDGPFEENFFGYYLLDENDCVFGMVLIHITIALWDSLESDELEFCGYTENDYQVKNLMENNFYNKLYAQLKEKVPQYLASNDQD